jgi:hypothetical protein
MPVLAPDILKEAQGLSIALMATIFGLGTLVWSLGWRAHRFWIVLATTAGAGILGLSLDLNSRAPSLVAGLLLALAAGALALALARLVAFAAGGLALWSLLHALLPGWADPLVCFLLGGLAALLLFRLWTMALTSLTGTLLMGYSGLCLAGRIGNVDIVALAENRALLLNCCCGLVTLAGLAIQFLLDRRKRDKKGGREHSRRESPDDRSGGERWWSRGHRHYRRAS